MNYNVCIVCKNGKLQQQQQKQTNKQTNKIKKIKIKNQSKTKQKQNELDCNCAYGMVVYKVENSNVLMLLQTY